MKNEQDLIRLVAKEDRTAFAELYVLLNEKVYNTALSYLQNTQDAEEVTQDVFVKIYKNAAKFQGNATVSTWVYRITINTSLNFIKRKKRFTLFSLGTKSKDLPDFNHPGVIMEKKEDARLLFSTIKTLPENQQTAFILSFIEHLPRLEVADIMGISLKAVESLLQRAKKNLRIKLKKRLS